MRWHYPLDPECPDVRDFHEGHDNDPISQMCGCLDEITQAWERKHMTHCSRCRAFGAANVSIEE